MDFATFFNQYGLILLLVVLLVFMFWSSRRRMQKQKAEQEAKAQQTVPGAEVLLQGGLYGTIVSYDAQNLDQPAIVELAPGVQIRVHSQAILRVVDSKEGAVTEDEFLESEESHAEYAEGVANGEISSISDDRKRAAGEGDADDTDPTSKPNA
ncbi:preprotein translocase subunit YajC [Microbacterium sp. BWT-B31]|uniref:preprotein translocase subunit YajC n=1 Tax=Microbacterium sp. BWT-B31 TaxID=3232072 RepID=UPI003528E0C7